MLRFNNFYKIAVFSLIFMSLFACSSNEETPEQKAERERVEREQAEAESKARAEQEERERILPPLHKYLNQIQSLTIDKLAESTKVHSKLTAEKFDVMRYHLLTYYGVEPKEEEENTTKDDANEQSTEEVQTEANADSEDQAQTKEDEQKDEPEKEKPEDSIVEHHFLDATGHPIDCITLTKQPTLKIEISSKVHDKYHKNLTT